MSYGIVEVFRTLQGEGINAGRSAIFVRFGGCNLWSGVDRNRAADADRTGATCPKFCDTDFITRGKISCDGLVALIVNELPADIVVFTGGEPALQLTAELVLACKAFGLETCIETNGTVRISEDVLEVLEHVCVSPKLPDSQIVVREGTELKVVTPRYSPNDYDELAKGFTFRFVSPEAVTTSVGKSQTIRLVEKAAAQWCMEHPPWRLSLQTHKHLEIP